MIELSSTALLIGVTDYLGSELIPLPSAKLDVEGLELALELNGDGTENFDVTSKVVGVDDAWGAHDLLEEVDRLIDDSEHFLFYFSGHGLLNKFGLQLATPEKEQAKDSGVYFDALLHRFNQSSAKEVTIILDCCYSGAAGDSSFAREDPIKRAAESLKLTHLREGVTILASSGRTQESEARAEGLSLFTGELLEGLNAHTDKTVDVIDLYNFTRRHLLTQTPVLRTFASRFSPLWSVTRTASEEARL
jgi:hypothetical protein